MAALYSLVLLISLQLASFLILASEVPVVFVLFGLPPLYLQINIELALRNNPVIVLTDQFSQIKSDNGAVYVDIRRYAGSGLKFEPVYRHMAKDQGYNKRKYELQCFIRWFILRDYMVNNNISRVFFGDGDTAVFANMTQAFDLRNNCNGVVNVELQQSNHHWVVAGESSLWTIDSIVSFCDFTQRLYANNLDTMFSKFRVGSTITDMSALWLWWVVNHKATTDPWQTGRPYQPFHCEHNPDPNHCEAMRTRFDDAFNFAKRLATPTLTRNLTLCNGLDIVARTAFDHQHGWLAGSGFSLNLNGSAIPSFYGNSSLTGGIPETLDPTELMRLSSTPVSLLTLHYQGNAKDHLLYDVCRVLLLSGGGKIQSETLRLKCDEVRQKEAATWPQCREHQSDYGSACV